MRTRITQWQRWVRVSATLFSLLVVPSQGGWMSGSESTDVTIYGNSMNRAWLYESSALAMQVEGCIWGYVSDNEEAGCMEDESEDGTTYWYQMANCRRAQVAYSMYSTTSGSAQCSSSTFVESFVTVDGFSNFIAYLSEHDANNPFGDNYNNANQAEGDDDAAAEQEAYDGNFDDLPLCEQSNNGGYVGIGCGDDGTFELSYFNDAYCLQPTGTTYDSLDNLNNAMKTYKNCAGIWYNGDQGDDGYTLPQYLISMSESCSSLDSGYCTDNSAMKDRRSHSSSSGLSLGRTIANKTWVTKLKYATGGLLLLASFVMFTGILFTNRRRRRALLQRKYRQSRQKRKHRSKSKSRKSSRSRSRAKSPRDENGGVFS